jgi:nucleoside-specific outer membrane channel protein Tsx
MSLPIPPRAVLLLLLALPLAAADWSDTFLGYRTGASFHEPTIQKEVRKEVLALGHASAYAWGSNFFNVDLLRSDLTDPANGGGQGAQEIYVCYRHHLAFGKAFRGKPLDWGPVKDVALTAGFEWNTKNTTFAPGKFAVVAGPTLQWKLPKGFLDTGLLYYKERNHNAFGAPTRTADFDGTWFLTAAWAVPIPLGPLASTFKGFANVQGPKGKDAAGVDTARETLSRSAWLLDVGTLAGLRKGALLLGPGFEYWQNKFGNPSPIPTATPGVTRPNTTTRCVTLQAEWHF